MIQRFRKVLTNAQIKALPTTGVTIVAAQGAGFLVEPFYATLTIITSAGAYTNVNAAASLAMYLNGTIDALGYVVNDTVIPATEVTNFFTSAARRKVVMVIPMRTEGNGWGPTSYSLDPTNLANTALTLKMNNAAGGDLTGGNVANFLTVQLWYDVVAVW